MLQRTDHNNRNSTPYCLGIVHGFFYVPQSYEHWRVVRQVYSLSPLSKKTRETKHLQVLLNRQHFLLSYLKTTSAGVAGVFKPQPPVQ